MVGARGGSNAGVGCSGDAFTAAMMSLIRWGTRVPEDHVPPWSKASLQLELDVPTELVLPVRAAAMLAPVDVARRVSPLGLAARRRVLGWLVPVSAADSVPTSAGADSAT